MQMFHVVDETQSCFQRPGHSVISFLFTVASIIEDAVSKEDRKSKPHLIVKDFRQGESKNRPSIP